MAVCCACRAAARVGTSLMRPPGAPSTHHLYLTGSSDDCDLFVVDHAFESFSVAFGFPQAFPDSTIDRMNEAIVRLQTYQGAVDMLDSTCARLCHVAGVGGNGAGSGKRQRLGGAWPPLAASPLHKACLKPPGMVPAQVHQDRGH